MKKINEFVSSYHTFRNIFILLYISISIYGWVVLFSVYSVVLGPGPFIPVLEFASKYPYLLNVFQLAALVVLVISFLKFRKATNGVQGSKIKLLRPVDYIAILVTVLFAISLLRTIPTLLDFRTESEKQKEFYDLIMKDAPFTDAEKEKQFYDIQMRNKPTGQPSIE